MKIVKFECGKYGVRKFKFLWWETFVDLIDLSLVWPPSSRHFDDCKGTFENAVKAYRRLKPPRYHVVDPLEEQNGTET